MPRRVLIATPFRHVLSPHYLNTKDSIINGISPNEFIIDWKVIVGTYVNFARNDIVYDAIERDYDDLIQLDEDNAPTADDVRRLLSFDEGIVAGVYCKKLPGYPKWTFVPEEGAEPDSRGLLKCNGLATGFLRTRVKELKQLYAHYRDRMFYTPAKSSAPMRRICELFPLGVIGPATPEGRLNEIREILKVHKEPLENDGFIKARVLKQIADAIDAPRPPGNMLGEDYYFTKLAREAGLTCWADLHNPISHIGNVAYPITPDKVGYDPEHGLKIPESHPI